MKWGLQVFILFLSASMLFANGGADEPNGSQADPNDIRLSDGDPNAVEVGPNDTSDANEDPNDIEAKEQNDITVAAEDPNAVEDDAEDATLEVEEIVKRAHRAAYYNGQDFKARVNMTITNGQGQTRSREFVILRKNVPDSNDQKYYAYFHRPSDVRDMTYMVHKNICSDANDIRQLYLPSLDMVKEIEDEDKRDSFVGSHYFYEDICGRNPLADEHELLSNNEKFYVVKHTPHEPNSVDFDYYYSYIDKENFLPMKTEYYDQENNLYRVIEIEQTEEIEEFVTPTKLVVRELSGGGHTKLEYSEIEYDIDMPDIFIDRFLTRPPRIATDQ